MIFALVPTSLHVPSLWPALLSLVVDGVVLTHFSLSSVMCGISFHVESLIRPTCRLVLLGSSPSAPRSLLILCASQHLKEVRVVPRFDSRRSTDGRCFAQVGSPSSRLAFGLTKRCGVRQMSTVWSEVQKAQEVKQEHQQCLRTIQAKVRLMFIVQAPKTQSPSLLQLHFRHQFGSLPTHFGSHVHRFRDGGVFRFHLPYHSRRCLRPWNVFIGAPSSFFL